jgi:2-amino-4,5-dihydroxy-6-oxo-7-(phosphooxy)heptanoate synthase
VTRGRVAAMTPWYESRKSIRLARLSRCHDGAYLFVPLDHSVSDGPVADRKGFSDLVTAVVRGGADGIIVHKGRVRAIDPDLLTDCALIVHLSASTGHSQDINEKVLVGDVEEAIRLGADAVSIHVNIGSLTESVQLADFGAVATACDRWNIPLIAMLYARGRHLKGSPRDPAMGAHLVNIAVDLGADIVKTVVTDPLEDMTTVVSSCPIPVIAAGGAADAGDPMAFASSVMLAGCRGVAMGRRVFQSSSPEQVVRSVREVIHGEHQRPNRSFMKKTSAAPTLVGAR